jgi:serine/threonine-protein kinase
MTPATIRCPSCATELPVESRFCSACGQALGSPSQMVTSPGLVPAVAVGIGRLVSSDSLPVARLAPGAILADRYRIIGLLGRGGMGEVYRADDLKLGQPVALKFLPAAVSADPVQRERFFAEVRITRQLAHPNICRVYDIAEAGGQHFLSMEYIDGEDLASLLQRIGHLSNEKALDIARQLAAGLTAAHERGVLHRDLKPSNVMLDGFGRVRITDFGLAIAVDDEARATDVSGTPAYMAPEQLAGKGTTVRSDIYSLGLVLYEIYAGQRAFKAPSIAELREQKETRTPTAPSDLRAGVDPVVERVIMRCLERDPRMRPASAAQVAAALPGGDPLAAAIAAGETPSPDLLIAAGPKEGLRPVIAVALLAVAILGTLAAVVMNDRVGISRRAQLTKPPDALIERARDFIRKAGYSDAPGDRGSGFFVDGDALQYIRDRKVVVNRPDDLEAAVAVGFFYRESPVPLLGVGPLSGVDPDNPPMQYPGEIEIQMDGEGRLRALTAVPDRVESAAPASAPDWAALFSEAGLDIAQWTSVEPERTPTFYADARAAWQGVFPEVPDVPVRIEAAAYRGKPVSFAITGPWSFTTPIRGLAGGFQAAFSTTAYAIAALGLVLGVSGLFFARRNLRLGRGDRRGAMRLMLLTLGLLATAWTFVEHHVASLGEAQLVAGAAGFYLPLAGLLWLFYIAVEPFVRRRWPQILVSWTRLLSGDWRDPVVGRDVLVGASLGIASGCLRLLALISGPAFGRSLTPALLPDWNLFNGSMSFIAGIVGLTVTGLITGLAWLLLLVLLRAALRRDWLAALVLWMVTTATVFSLTGGTSWPGTALALIHAALIVWLLMRVGLLATIVADYVTNLFVFSPLTMHASAWYAGIGYGVLFVTALITLYGFRVSLGGRPMLGPAGIDD